MLFGRFTGSAGCPAALLHDAERRRRPTTSRPTPGRRFSRPPPSPSCWRPGRSAAGRSTPWPGWRSGLAVASKPNLLAAIGFIALPVLETVRLYGWGRSCRGSRPARRTMTRRAPSLSCSPRRSRCFVAIWTFRLLPTLRLPGTVDLLVPARFPVAGRHRLLAAGAIGRARLLPRHPVGGTGAGRVHARQPRAMGDGTGTRPRRARRDAAPGRENRLAVDLAVMDDPRHGRLGGIPHPLLRDRDGQNAALPAAGLSADGRDGRDGAGVAGAVGTAARRAADSPVRLVDPVPAVAATRGTCCRCWW